MGDRTNKKGVHKMCLLKNTPGSRKGNYKNKKRSVCISIHGLNDPEKLKKCMKKDLNFCFGCCGKFAKNGKNGVCEKDCKAKIIRAKAEVKILKAVKKSKKKPVKQEKKKKEK